MLNSDPATNFQGDKTDLDLRVPVLPSIPRSFIPIPGLELFVTAHDISGPAWTLKDAHKQPCISVAELDRLMALPRQDIRIHIYPTIESQSPIAFVDSYTLADTAVPRMLSMIWNHNLRNQTDLGLPAIARFLGNCDQRPAEARETERYGKLSLNSQTGCFCDDYALDEGGSSEKFMQLNEEWRDVLAKHSKESVGYLLEAFGISIETDLVSNRWDRKDELLVFWPVETIIPTQSVIQLIKDAPPTDSSISDQGALLLGNAIALVSQRLGGRFT